MAMRAAERAEALAQPADSLRAEIERLRTALAQAEARIAELEARADIDPLLDILNRRAFERELARSVAYLDRYGGTAALVYLDLDGFKTINDRHGHDAGDALLKAVASALTAAVRASDVVARLGGDEFAVLLWNASAAQAQAKALELEAAVARAAISHGGAPLSVAASAGMAAVRPGCAPAETIAAADRAMYARKSARQAGSPTR